MKYVYQIRNYGEEQTISNVIVIDTGKIIYTCYLLELPYRDNKKNISCIDEGYYTLKKREANEDGSKFSYQHFEIIDVYKRNEIKWHIANYVKQLRGCGAPGLRLANINNDGNLDVTSSRLALETLWHFLDDENMLIIISG